MHIAAVVAGVLVGGVFSHVFTSGYLRRKYIMWRREPKVRLDIE